TAQRGGEVGSMQWSDVDLTAGWWTIPAERSKNGLAHRVPLSLAAVRILESLRKEADESNSERRKTASWIFLGGRGDDYHRPVHTATHQTKLNWKIAYSRPRDFPRTAASLMTGMGTPRLVVSKILNHVESGVTRVYDRHSYDREKREALDAWSRRLTVIVS